MSELGVSDNFFMMQKILFQSWTQIRGEREAKRSLERVNENSFIWWEKEACWTAGFSFKLVKFYFQKTALPDCVWFSS